MPGAVVKVADLLFVLHHVGWLASLFVLHCNIVLDCLKVLSMLKGRVVEVSRKCQNIYTWEMFYQAEVSWTFYLVEPLKEAVFVLCAPRLPLPTSSLLVTSLLLLVGRPLALGCLGHSWCGAGHGPRLSHSPLG